MTLCMSTQVTPSLYVMLHIHCTRGLTPKCFSYRKIKYCSRTSKLWFSMMEWPFYFESEAQNRILISKFDSELRNWKNGHSIIKNHNFEILEQYFIFLYEKHLGVGIWPFCCAVQFLHAWIKIYNPLSWC